MAEVFATLSLEELGMSTAPTQFAGFASQIQREYDLQRVAVKSLGDPKNYGNRISEATRQPSDLLVLLGNDEQLLPRVARYLETRSLFPAPTAVLQWRHGSWSCEGVFAPEAVESPFSASADVQRFRVYSAPELSPADIAEIVESVEGLESAGPDVDIDSVLRPDLHPDRALVLKKVGARNNLENRLAEGLSLRPAVFVVVVDEELAEATLSVAHRFRAAAAETRLYVVVRAARGPTVVAARSANFSVDAALLSELGERLVGKPYIALAELIKNAYDADATSVTVEIADDSIAVTDNGHGMSQAEFLRHWLRVGTTHKRDQRVSRKLNRPLTGSKGVGRLAVQFLGERLSFRSSADGIRQLSGTIDWPSARRADELSDVRVDFAVGAANSGFIGARSGTELVVRGLNHSWDGKAVEELARQVWALQPPYGGTPDARRFTVDLRSQFGELESAFREQNRAIFDIWQARIRGRLANGGRRLVVGVEIGEGTPEGYSHTYDDAPLRELSFEILVFHLRHRQPRGISVADARRYLEDFGGVNVFDAGFRLPYYGTPEADWLGLEEIHARRISRSDLLPEELHVPGALTYLPTRTRMYGVVKVNTAAEQADAPAAKDTLAIQISRDRLVENAAFVRMRDAVNRGVHFYATLEARRRFAETLQHVVEVDTSGQLFESVAHVVEHFSGEMSRAAFQTLRTAVKAEQDAVAARLNLQREYLGILGGLATTGATTLALSHENRRQLEILRGLVRRAADAELSTSDLVESLTAWIARAEGTQQILSPLLDEESRSERASFNARKVVDETWRQMEGLRGGAELKNDVAEGLFLPHATYAEWSSILQNLVFNALNATRWTSQPKLRWRSSESQREVRMTLDDNGTGVSLADSERLFEPFVRRAAEGLGEDEVRFGGSGLGLPIVRMLCRTVGVSVAFVAPPQGFATSVEISWKEAR